MNSIYLSTIIVIVAIIVVAAIIVNYFVNEKKRREGMQQAAIEMGMSYSPKDDGNLLSSLVKFHIFSQGHSRKIVNLIDGAARQAQVSIFDYRYTTGGGKHSHTWNQTVIRFQLEHALPSFSLRPQNLFDAIGGWLGQQDINFDDYPGFSKMYLLRGEDETATRGLFGSNNLTFYEQNEGLCTEAQGNTLLVYRQGKRVKPDELRTFLETGYSVLALFYRPW